eukprot:GHRQ01028433.1.p2 GENE.GHRQ01028433.1~~GHRQ01028433.1.p2  ORF type:complete len:103 (+),score=14.12 GHRQ01028433.1:368-676(+)
MSGPGQQKVCAFCSGDAAAHGGRLGRLEGPYNVSRSGYEAVYVHHECAVWSPNVSWRGASAVLSATTCRASMHTRKLYSQSADITCPHLFCFRPSGFLQTRA